jgi:hypothetical protein
MIAGLTRIYYKKRGPGNYWGKLPHAARSWSENEDLIDYYRTQWGALYQYKITADSDICQPLA